MGYIVIAYTAGLPDAHALAERISDVNVMPVAVFRYPNRSELTCRGSCIENKTSPFTRDPFGFMKCAVCGGRHRHTRRRIIGALFDYLGANLLKTDPPATFKTPDGYGPEAR